MIRLIEAKGYKCLRYVRQLLEPFQILVGSNASGKSTFLDVVSFIQDILSHDLETAIRKRARTLRELTWQGSGEPIELAVELELPEPLVETHPTHYLRYEVQIESSAEGTFSITGENLWLIDRAKVSQRNGAPQRSLFPEEREPKSPVVLPFRKNFPSGWRKVLGRNPEGRVYVRSETSDWNIGLRPLEGRAGLMVVPEEERFPATTWARKFLLEGIQTLRLDSLKMREPCSSELPTVLRADGSNLHIVIQSLKTKYPAQFQRWLEHLKTVLYDLQDLEVVERDSDRYRYIQAVFLSTQHRVPAWLLSDGTLRFLALTLIAYLPNNGTVYFIEEPENGIHPRAIEAVFQSLSSVYNGQVLCATHSPILLNIAEPKQLLCFARTASGATDIVRGDEHPYLKKWRKEVALGDLLATGILG